MFEVKSLSVAIAIMVTAANDSLDSAADNNLLESETNNKGQPFYVKNLSMIQPYLGGCQIRYNTVCANPYTLRTYTNEATKYKIRICPSLGNCNLPYRYMQVTVICMSAIHFTQNSGYL